MFIINNFSVKKTLSHSSCPEIDTAETKMPLYVTYSVITQTAEPNLLLHLGKMTQNAMFSYGR
jgi:hypothetical protein